MKRHHIVVREFSEFWSRPGFQGVGGIACPVGGFEVEIAAEEGMEVAFWIDHFLGCLGGGVVPFIVFAGFWEGREGARDIWFLGGSGRGGGDGVEGQSRSAFEGVGHHHC